MSNIVHFHLCPLEKRPLLRPLLRSTPRLPERSDNVEGAAAEGHTDELGRSSVGREKGKDHLKEYSPPYTNSQMKPIPASWKANY